MASDFENALAKLELKPGDILVVKKGFVDLRDVQKAAGFGFSVPVIPAEEVDAIRVLSVKPGDVVLVKKGYANGEYIQRVVPKGVNIVMVEDVEAARVLVA